MAAPQNIVGPKIKALRRGQKLTQEELAARCGMLGWDVGENVITKIETQIRCVVDIELLCLAKALRVDPAELLPGGSAQEKTVKSYYAEKHR